MQHTGDHSRWHVLELLLCCAHAVHVYALCALPVPCRTLAVKMSRTIDPLRRQARAMEIRQPRSLMATCVHRSRRLMLSKFPLLQTSVGHRRINEGTTALKQEKNRHLQQSSACDSLNATQARHDYSGQERSMRPWGQGCRTGGVSADRARGVDGPTQDQHRPKPVPSTSSASSQMGGGGQPPLLSGWGNLVEGERSYPLFSRICRHAGGVACDKVQHKEGRAGPIRKSTFLLSNGTSSSCTDQQYGRKRQTHTPTTTPDVFIRLEHVHTKP